MSYSKEFKVVVATIYGEADASSVRSWEVIAHSMRNRIGFGNWTEYSTIYGIATTTGYDAYTSKNIPYYEAMSQFNSGNISNLLKKLIDTVLPIYEGKIKDNTNGVISYWSPEAQKKLHRDKPRLYTTAVPDWVKDNRKEIVIIDGTEKDDFQWLRFKRSKMFITLRDNKSLPMDGVSVDIRFASGKKVPVLSNLKTNSKGQLPVFFARIEMGARFIVDGTYLKDKKGSNLKILPTGKDIVATIIVDTGNGFKSSLEKHETGSENTQVRNDTVGIDSTQKTNNTSNSERVNDLKEVTFNIKLVEGDTGKPLPNTTYHLEYKNNIKPHKTDSSGIESGIKADVSQSIGVYLDDDSGKKQSIYSMAFPVTGDLNGQTKVLKVPVVTLQLKFVDKSKKPIPNYQFKTVYRGQTSETKKANVRGIAIIKALAGQHLKLIDGEERATTTAIVTYGSKSWTITIDKNISKEDVSKVSKSKEKTIPETSSVVQESKSTKKENATQTKIEKPKVKEVEKKTKDGPTLEVESDQTEITIKFIDEKNNKPLSGLSYITKSTKYGKNSSITGSDGTRGRPHESLVGVEITVIVSEDGKEVKKGSFIVNNDRDKVYIYKAKKPEFEKGIITYNIYEDHQIIKYIPKNISSSNKQKYKYIYYEKNGKKHNICTVNWNTTKEKSKGEKRSSKPTHASILYDKKVNQGQTSRRVKYENGDIAEYGINNGEYFWRLFKALSGDITLVRMPDSLKYNNSNVKISYTFSNTQRRYTSPGHLACFIGALATTGLAIQSTGSCFEEGTGFPSTSHNNGRSVDTIYLTNQNNEQKYITAMKNFGCHTQYRGRSKPKYEWTTPAAYHDSHLHSMFDEKRVKIIRE
ncbi:hypothetical protein [Psychrobacter immobilis]|uniref:hypothetical protein n=1 Tax=Psychrobacter immobilis TaxID=498 RepID=UPI0019196FDF|nr:hypothetical protein [Psychrobacter immobilis]